MDPGPCSPRFVAWAGTGSRRAQSVLSGAPPPAEAYCPVPRRPRRTKFARAGSPASAIFSHLWLARVVRASRPRRGLSTSASIPSPASLPTAREGVRAPSRGGPGRARGGGVGPERGSRARTIVRAGCNRSRASPSAGLGVRGSGRLPPEPGPEFRSGRISTPEKSAPLRLFCDSRK